MDTSAYKKTNVHAGWPAFFLFAKYIINILKKSLMNTAISNTKVCTFHELLINDEHELMNI